MVELSSENDKFLLVKQLLLIILIALQGAITFSTAPLAFGTFSDTFEGIKSSNIKAPIFARDKIVSIVFKTNLVVILSEAFDQSSGSPIAISISISIEKVLGPKS